MTGGRVTLQGHKVQPFLVSTVLKCCSKCELWQHIKQISHVCLLCLSLLWLEDGAQSAQRPIDSLDSTGFPVLLKLFFYFDDR